MSREFDTYDLHCTIFFLSSLLEGLSTNEAIFLGQTPTASEGALLYDCYTARCTSVIRMKFPLLRRHFPAGEKQRPTTWTAVPSCLSAVSRSTR